MGFFTLDANHPLYPAYQSLVMWCFSGRKYWLGSAAGEYLLRPFIGPFAGSSIGSVVGRVMDLQERPQSLWNTCWEVKYAAREVMHAIECAHRYIVLHPIELEVAQQFQSRVRELRQGDKSSLHNTVALKVADATDQGGLGLLSPAIPTYTRVHHGRGH
jgi:hypothetical protein